MLARNILIFHSGALGDFIQTWPLGLALGRLYPQSRVMYVTQRQKGLLAEKALRLEFMDVEAGWHHLFGDASNLPDLCRRRLETSHSIFSFVAQPNDLWTKSVAQIAPAAHLTALTPGPARQILHDLQSIPAVHAATMQLMASIAERGLGTSHCTGGPVAIHPGSGSPAKCWPVDCYLELVDRLHKEGQRCRILLGEVELERWSSDDIHRLQSADETVHPATYLDLLRELSTCSAFVGNDSGPGHLAGMIGLPSLILFGPTDPNLWKPQGPRVRAIRSEPLSSLAVDGVLREVLDSLPRRLTVA